MFNPTSHPSDEEFLTATSTPGTVRHFSETYIFVPNAIWNELGFRKQSIFPKYVLVFYRHHACNVLMFCTARAKPSNEDTYQIDQSIRVALGIDFHVQNFSVAVKPISPSVSYIIRELISRILGRRYLYLRVAKLDVPDLEKNLARTPIDALSILEMSSGDKAVFDSVQKDDRDGRWKLRTTSIDVFKADQEYLQRRHGHPEFKPNFQGRYPNPLGILDVYPDLHPVFADLELQQDIGAYRNDNPRETYVASTRVRRSVSNQLLKESINFGILVLFASFALEDFVGNISSHGELFNTLASLLLSLLLSIILVILKIRFSSGNK